MRESARSTAPLEDPDPTLSGRKHAQTQRPIAVVQYVLGPPAREVLSEWLGLPHADGEVAIQFESHWNHCTKVKACCEGSTKHTLA